MRLPSLSILLVLASLSPGPSSAATLSGKVLEKGVKAPLAGVNLLLETLSSSSLSVPTPGATVGPTSDAPLPTYNAVSDLEGDFSLEAPEGTYRLTLIGMGLKSSVLSGIELKGDGVQDLFLERDGFSLPEVVVMGEAQKVPLPSRETLGKDELTKVPGTGGDVLKALQSLPGVAAIGDLSGQMLVRGGGPQDNLYLLDRIPIAFPFHFGGLISTINSDLIEKVDFSAGGFGPEYGNFWGGVIDVTQRSGRSDRWGARAEVNLLLSEALVEGPLFPQGTLALAGRRSYLELMGGLFDDFTAIPSFSDYQVKSSWDPSNREHWDLQVFGSDDRLGLVISPDSELAQQDPAYAGVFEFHNGYDSQGMNFRTELGPDTTLWNTLHHFDFFFATRLGDELNLRITYEDWGDRLDLVHGFGEGVSLRAGLEYHHALIGSQGLFVRPPSEGDPDFDLTSAERISTDFSTVSNNIGLYAEQRFRWFGGKAEFSLGGRLDYQTYNSKLDPSPRFSVAVFPVEGTVVKASYGHYHQLPIQGPYLNPDFGNPDLDSGRCASAILGVEQRLEEGLSLKVEAYQKTLSRMVVPDPWSRYSNQGSGTSRGIEVFLRRAPSERLFGWVSYAFSESFRYDGTDLPARLYDYDQPHILTCVVGYKVNPGWEVGLKWRFSSGQPETPILGSFQDPSSGRYLPLYGPVNSVRLPDYHRLDLSTSLRTTYETWEWRVFLEVLNLYDQPNVFAHTYNADYTQRKDLHQLPLLPYLGFEAKY